MPRTGQEHLAGLRTQVTWWQGDGLKPHYVQPVSKLWQS